MTGEIKDRKEGFARAGKPKKKESAQNAISKSSHSFIKK